ncbi:MAG: hypothetical protein Q8P18_09700 [Pseudomonadota bacterium]|nr:hypothetical protein [Pseudomonadota bacterium]
MPTLLLSLLAMAVAPLADRALRGRPWAAGFADGLIQVVVGGILLVYVLPFGLEAAGWPALVALGGGAMVGILAHSVPGGERSVGALAVLALLVHAGIDGAALAAPDAHGGHAGEGLLAWAVVLHTLPVGLATWRISSQRAGRTFAAGLLLATAAVTVAGWFAADRVMAGASPAALGVAECAVAGALLHVLGHAGEGVPRRPAGWGGLVGVGMVLGAGELEAGEPGAGNALLALLLACAPAVLLGYLAAGVLHASAPAPRPRSLAERVGEGARFGLIELVDRTAPWIVALLGLAALVKPLLAPDSVPGAPVTPVEIAAMALVLLLYAGALVRHGPSSFLAPLLRPRLRVHAGSGTHSGACGHDHSHGDHSHGDHLHGDHAPGEPSRDGKSRE